VVSAEALNPRQFGPGGKYTTRFLDWGRPTTTGRPTMIQAVHTKSGRHVGAMSWFPPAGEGGRHVQGSPDPTKPAIFKIGVSKPQQRKGVATAMLEHAREIAPGLQHSTVLTDEGRAWAQARP
jgi:GNAT superfamily N-acetyltransferase